MGVVRARRKLSERHMTARVRASAAQARVNVRVAAPRRAGDGLRGLQICCSSTTVRQMSSNTVCQTQEERKQTDVREDAVPRYMYMCLHMCIDMFMYMYVKVYVY